MNALDQLRGRLRTMFGRRQWEADMAEEMRLHLQQRTEEFVVAGMTVEEAHFAAQRQFGGIEQIKELAREQRGLLWVENLGQDLRYATRMLRKQPAFTAVAVLTLALGIGATSAIFSVVNSVLLRPLPYVQPQELMLIGESLPPQIGQAGTSPGSYLAWRQQARGLASIAAWTYGPYNLTGEGEPRRVFSQRVTANYFGTIGIAPELGRVFAPGEDTAGKDNVVILSHSVWLDQFGGRTTAVGQTILLDERPCVIIGVMPERFLFDRRAEIYTPYVFTAAEQKDYSQRTLLTVGRLAPGVTRQQARDELNIVARRLAHQFPATNRGWGVQFTPLLTAAVLGVQPLLLSLFGAVASLLLIACANIANLLLARATSRQREIAVRVTLGAGRGRIIRQLLGESLLIAAVGGVLGVLLAYGGLHLLIAFAPEGLPRLREISMDGRALAFTCLLAIATGVGFGLVPALEATAVNAVETLKDGGQGVSASRRRVRLRSLLVVVEISLALILLACAGLLARSFLRLRQVDSGYEPRGVYMSNIALITQKYPSDPARAAFVSQTIAQLAQLPGVQSVGFTNHTLPTMGARRVFFTIAGQQPGPFELPPAFYYSVSAGYFETMGIPLIRGRFFSQKDRADAPRVMVINQEMARLYFPNSDPIGQRISIGRGPEVWREIVGIVGNVLQGGPSVRAQVYDAFPQSPSASTTFVMRTTLGATELAAADRTAIHAVDRDIPIMAMYPLTPTLSRNIESTRFTLFLFGVFAGTALLLAAIGVYGVMTYAVTQRTGEIGIRMALGAQRRDVIWLVLRQGGRMVAAGLVAGLVGAFAISRLLEWMLFEVSPHDPLTLAVIVALLSFVAFLACWLPARRATRVDPLVALRCE